MSNILYDAVMALGKSIENIDRSRWIRGTLQIDNHMCAIGLVTAGLNDGHSFYPADVSAEDVDDQILASRVACEALIEALTPEQQQNLRRRAEWVDMNSNNNRDVCRPYINNALAGTFSEPHDWQTPVVVANDDDTIIGDWYEARLWFTRALDLLAKRLPEPIPATPLTVDEILVSAPVERTPQLV